jgi:hypothetical protein
LGKASRGALCGKQASNISSPGNLQGGNMRALIEIIVFVTAVTLMVLAGTLMGGVP